MSPFTSLDKQERIAMEHMARLQNFKKGEIIFYKGERSRHEVFVKSGIVRSFIIDEDGNDKSTAFFQEGEFMSTKTLRTPNGVLIYHYQALSATKLLIFDSEQLKKHFSANKKLISIGREVKEKELARLYHRNECLMQTRAADKYQKFIHFYPDLEQHISQRYIASYLGITPVSLSRLKKARIIKTVIN